MYRVLFNIQTLSLAKQTEDNANEKGESPALLIVIFFLNLLYLKKKKD